jgi:hypothetical protein
MGADVVLDLEGPYLSVMNAGTAALGAQSRRG